MIGLLKYMYTTDIKSDGFFFRICFYFLFSITFWSIQSLQVAYMEKYAE